MKKRLKVILLLFFILFFIAGCVDFSSLPLLGGKQDQPTVGRGIKMYFLPGAPPTDKIMVSSNSVFLVKVGIDNYGPTVSGTLSFWDNLPNGIGGDQGVDSQPADLDAGQPIYGNPSNPQLITKIQSTTLYFTPKNGNSADGEIRYDPSMIAPGVKLNIFAEFQTDNYNAEVPASFCLKREADTNVPCSNQEVITSAKLGPSASYLPITVSRIEKTATPFREDNFFVNFKIVLDNLGGGDIITKDGKKDILNSLQVSVDGQDFTNSCSPNVGQTGQLIFSNGEAIINCAIEGLKGGQSYTDHFIDVRYGFPYRLRIKAGPIPLSIISQNSQN